MATDLNYEAILFAPDGDYVRDHRRHTVEEVIDALNDQGSRWYFYPFHAVIKNYGYQPRYLLMRQRLISVAPPFEDFKGKAVKTLMLHIAHMEESELEVILNG